MSDPNLLKHPTETDARDAIHVAIIPVMSDVDLKSGQRVGFSNGKATKEGPFIGIVNPFVEGKVKAGTLFWLMLMPRTVTGMRHHWQHPLFEEMPSYKAKCTKAESEAWLRNFCETSDCPGFETTIAAALGKDLINYAPEYYDSAYRNDGEYLHFSGYDAHGEIPPEFWDHVENYAGVSCPKRASWFSCSC